MPLVLIYYFTILYLPICIVLYAGFFAATTERTYSVINMSDGKYVVVGCYGDKMLTMPVDEKQKTVIRKLYLYKIDDLASQKVALEEENIGPLTIAK
jgi:hypothetical protein